MTRHYVLVASYDYEGNDVRGVFDTFDATQAFADTEMAFEGEDRQFIEEWEDGKFLARAGRTAQVGGEWKFYG